MTDSVEGKLKECGLEIPTPAASLANYVPALQVGGFLYISGQLPVKNGRVMFEGSVGSDLGVDEAKKAAELCLLNVLGQVKHSVGSFDNVVRCVRLGGFVHSGSSFKEHASVVNGASDLLVHVLGDRGRHVRAAVGCSSLPLGAAVEVEAIFQVKGDRPA
jgi:enamine deaminase RidA (YjgF/YER057c/UK114 family)